MGESLLLTIHEKQIEAHLFGSMEEDECDYDHILIDDPITHGGEKGRLWC